MPPVKQLGPRVVQKRKQKYPRSKSGCYTCRRRRVKCDQRKPVCERCANLERECLWVKPEEKDEGEGDPHQLGTQWSQGSEVMTQSIDSSNLSQRSELEETDSDKMEHDDIRGDLVHDCAFSDWILGSPMNELANVAAVNQDITLPTTYHASVALNDLPDSTHDLSHDMTSVGSSTSSSEHLQIVPVIPARASPLSQDFSESALAKRRSKKSAESPITLESIMPLLQSLDPFYHAFPSTSNLELFHLFLNSTSRFVVAMNNPQQNFNPFVSVALPLALADHHSVAADGVRHALLSLTAAHQHHQHRETSQARSASMLHASNREKKLAFASMISNVAIGTQAEVDILLATCMILKARDVLLADHAWRSNLDFAIRLISRHHGPGALLAETQNNFTRRFILDQLTMTDVISTFSTGQEPILLSGSNSWWFECEKSCSSSTEWEAFEHQFGISRETVELLARARQLIFYNVHLDSEDPASTAQAAQSIVRNKALAVIDELRTGSVNQFFIPKRTRSGDSAYRYCISIMLLTEILGYSSNDERVQTSVKSLLELCAESSLQPVMLMWPLLYAGANAVSAEDRAWVKSLFETFALSHCYDLMAAHQLLQAQWARLDAGQPFMPWHSLMELTKIRVLLI